MSRKTIRSKRTRSIRATVCSAVLLVALILTCFTSCLDGVIDEFLNSDDNPIFTPEDDTPIADPNQDTTQNDTDKTTGELNIHFIDVGQADCILVLSNDKVMLVDTGDTSSTHTDKIISYLKNLDISKIDYLILTHPDSDHIGGAPEIITEFDIAKCIMPDFAKSTKIYERTLDALETENVDVSIAEPGEAFEVGEVACKILAPLKSYNDANEISIVIRLDFGAKSVLLTGDAEGKSEADMVAQYSAEELKVDVLKSGHHGSNTSSSSAFLNKVKPTYAVISCGKGNSFGHPHSETIDRYEAYGIEYYRTDLNGTVIMKTDGNTISFTCEKNS